MLDKRKRLKRASSDSSVSKQRHIAHARKCSGRKLADTRIKYIKTSRLADTITNPRLFWFMGWFWLCGAVGGVGPCGSDSNEIFCKKSRRIHMHEIFYCKVYIDRIYVFCGVAYRNLLYYKPGKEKSCSSSSASLAWMCFRRAWPGGSDALQMTMASR